MRPSLVYTQGAHSGAVVDDAKNRQVGIRGVKLTPSLSKLTNFSWYEQLPLA